MDPRKTIIRPDQEAQNAMRQIALAHLRAVTEEGAKAIGCTGASFVVMGIAIWGAELAELDARAAAQMMRAIGDLYDPASSAAKKAHAEKKRRAAVTRLFAALDLEMARPEGRA